MRFFSIILFFVIAGGTQLGCQKKSKGDSRTSSGEPDAGTLEVDENKEEALAPANPAAVADDPPATEELGGINLESATVMSEKIALRPAAVIGTIAVSLTEPSDLSKFKEEKYVWNPAQIPLEELNKIVCVLSNTGFHLNQDKGKYIAKIILDECLASEEQLSNPDFVKAQPADVIVESKKDSNGDINLKIWFARIISAENLSATEHFTHDFFGKIKLNYYVQAKIIEIPGDENPFGIFNMNWEMVVEKDGVKDTLPYQEGYVETKKNNDTLSLKYNQKNWSYSSQQCPDGSFATYQGFDFQDNTPGTGNNNTTLNFDGSKSIATVIAEAGGGINVDLTPDSVLPIGVATLTGGTDQTYSEITLDGILIRSYVTGNPALDVFPGDTLQDFLDRYVNEGLYVDASVDLSTPLTQGNYTLVNGSNGTNADNSGALFHGIRFNSDSPGAGANGVLTFDGIKKLKDVIDDYRTLYGYNIDYSINDYGAFELLVLPNPAPDTISMSGGIDKVAATATFGTSGADMTLTTSDTDGRGLNGFKIYFDGIRTADEQLSELAMPVMDSAGAQYPPPSISTGLGTDIPDEGTVTLTGGAGPEKDVYAQIREFSANAELSLASGKPVKGRAHTAEGWNHERVSGTCPTSHNGDEKPISYGMAFDKYDTYPGHKEPSDAGSKVKYPGRSATKQFNDYVDANAAVAGYNPDAVRCEQVGGEMANVWEWALFDASGKRLEHKTDFPLFLEGSTSNWGDGWVSQWGIHVWADVSTGDKAYIKKSDGSKRLFDIVRFNGDLLNSEWRSMNTAQNTGTIAFTCDAFCPSGGISQDMLNNQWTSSYFSYDQEYVFDYATKILKLDTNKDGTGDVVVELNAGAEGWFELELVEKGGSETYRYSLSSWSSFIGLKEGSTFYSPPKKIVFDTSTVYDNDSDAYPGSEAFNASHDGETFADLIDGTDLFYEYGNLCCFSWEEKVGIKDQWGGFAHAQSVTLAKGTELTVDTSGGDPDGNGPIVDGTKIKIAPKFTELRPLSKDDCSTDLTDDLNSLETELPLPGPKSNAADRKISAKIGNRPTGTYPLLIMNGDPL